MPEINTESYDAQQTAEEIAAGDQPAPKVNVSADYEAAQEFSTSKVDETQSGKNAAEAATASQLKTHPAAETKLSSDTPSTNSTGNPEDYRGMAKQVHSSENEAGNVDDDLVKKALDLGKPGE
ncbi:MAG TPA: hypothetical protein VL134_05445 [Leptolyngbya sp.]|jgi:hypothetical protein|nr:hypothetical protein [Leptolyngbya sp.]